MRNTTLFKSIFLGSLLLLSACEDFLSPELDNSLQEEELLKNPAGVEGLLLRAYNLLPNDYNFNLDVASDDAVTNDRTSSFQKMATGAWRSNFDPNSKWSNSYQALNYIHLFLDKYESADWSNEEPAIKEGHLKRLKGEAHALRAWHNFQLLQNHGGIGSDGKLLGFPILTKALSIEDNFQLPRNTYAECVKQILDDCDVAIANLPVKYVNVGTDPVINNTIGSRFTNRVNGNAVKALKSRVLLYAASPAFAESEVTWEQAAKATGAFLKEAGGLTTVSAKGLTFFKTKDDPEIIWANSQVLKRSWEENNFPPSLFGKGRTNPTQELVDAFPMLNGYPINHPSSGYAANNPYKDRDPRLKEYIVYNGNSIKSAVSTYEGAAQDGINSLLTSTRTGYYIRKFMDSGVNFAPGTNVVNTQHFMTHFRFTEVLLNYAEAANEAWGPDSDPEGFGFTARKIVEAIRKRAGLKLPDAYLTAITSKEDFRNLLRTERRIELCFEGHRFWDIRRWNDVASMTLPVSSMTISTDQTKFTVSKVEDRLFQPFMVYGPIPFNETLKYNIVQNKGW